jgi:hypothetical protein
MFPVIAVRVKNTNNVVKGCLLSPHYLQMKKRGRRRFSGKTASVAFFLHPIFCFRARVSGVDDRIIHHATIIEIDAESYRKKHHKKAK